jgi:hypothetical protein
MKIPMGKIYVSGYMPFKEDSKGGVYHDEEYFKVAIKALSDMKFEGLFNPVESYRAYSDVLQEYPSLNSEQVRKYNLCVLLLSSKVIMLPNWWRSRYAREERRLARKTGIPIVYSTKLAKENENPIGGMI